MSETVTEDHSSSISLDSLPTSQIFIAVSNAVGSIIIVCCSGYYLVKNKTISVSHAPIFSQYLFQVTLPSLLLSQTSKGFMDPSLHWAPVAFFAVVNIFLGHLVGFLVAKYLLVGWGSISDASFVGCFGLCNCFNTTSIIPLCICGVLFGEHNVLGPEVIPRGLQRATSYVAIYFATMQLLLWTFGYHVLKSSAGEEFPPAEGNQIGNGGSARVGYFKDSENEEEEEDERMGVLSGSSGRQQQSRIRTKDGMQFTLVVDNCDEDDEETHSLSQEGLHVNRKQSNTDSHRYSEVGRGDDEISHQGYHSQEVSNVSLYTDLPGVDSGVSPRRSEASGGAEMGFHDSRTSFSMNMDLDDDRDRNASLLEKSYIYIRNGIVSQKDFIQRIFSPPLIAVCMSFIISNVSFLRATFLNEHAPLKFMIEGAELLGTAIVPLGLFIVGMGLAPKGDTLANGNGANANVNGQEQEIEMESEDSHGENRVMLTEGAPADKKILDKTALFASIFLRLIVMPVIGLGFVMFLEKFMVNSGANGAKGEEGLDKVMLFVILTEAAMPVTGLLSVMCNIFQRPDHGSAVGEIVFWQYVSSIITISLLLPVFILLLWK
eukprot:Nk52_evm2s360 gene=Nk52_evmTU2s360